MINIVAEKTKDILSTDLHDIYNAQSGTIPVINIVAEKTKDILSTALHDIYNEINNLFFVSESLLESCQCLSTIQKEEFQKDFFSIINQIKGKQFLFNNIFNNKTMAIENFKKNINNLFPINGSEEIAIDCGLLCCLGIISHGTIEITSSAITCPIKPRLLKDEQLIPFWANDLLKNHCKNLNFSIHFHMNQLTIKMIL